MPDVPENILKTARNKEEKACLIDQYTAKWRQKNLEKAGTKQRYMMLREKIIEGLLVLETLLVLLLLIIQ